MKKYHLVSYFFADLASLKGKKITDLFSCEKGSLVYSKLHK